MKQPPSNHLLATLPPLFNFFQLSLFLFIHDSSLFSVSFSQISQSRLSLSSLSNLSHSLSTYLSFSSLFFTNHNKVQSGARDQMKRARTPHPRYQWGLEGANPIPIGQDSNLRHGLTLTSLGRDDRPAACRLGANPHGMVSSPMVCSPVTRKKVHKNNL